MTETAVSRQYKVQLVLKARNDVYPGPPTLRLASQPGPAPAGRVPCACTRVRAMWANGVQVKTLVADPYCLICGGTALRAFNSALDKPGDGEMDGKGRVIDLYTLGADRAGASRVLPSEPRKVSSEPREDGFSWERRHPVFAQINRRLDALRIKDEEAWYYTVCAYTEGRYGFDDGEPRLGFSAGFAVMRGLRFLETRMPKPIRLPAVLQQRFDEWELTRRIHGVNGSVRARARLVGVDRRTVRKRMKGAA